MEAIVAQQISIAKFFAERGLFAELGGHFARCEPEDLIEMDQQACHTESVSKGVKAFTETMPTVSVLKLASKLKPYPTLWAGFLTGFRDGMTKRVSRTTHNEELAKLVVALSNNRELGGILQDALNAADITVALRQIRVPMQDDPTPVVAIGRPGSPSDIYVVIGPFARKTSGIQTFEHLLLAVSQQAQLEFTPLA